MPIARLADADRAEFDAGVPQRLGPSAQELLHLLGPGVGGEVQVSAEPAQQRVAHTAADQVQLVAGVSEHAAQVRAAHRDGRFSATCARRKQFGVSEQS